MRHVAGELAGEISIADDGRDLVAERGKGFDRRVGIGEIDYCELLVLKYVTNEIAHAIVIVDYEDASISHNQMTCARVVPVRGDLS